MNYLGDFAEDATVYIPFNTFSSDDPSASATITNLADGDVHVHKDGSTTEIATDGASVAIDFDTITGNHLITIDTSVDAAYSTGSDYLVRIEGTTVDGATVNAWVGHFSIQNRYMRGTDSAGTATELAKVPKSDGTTSWNATALGDINAQADTAISDAALATAAALADVDTDVNTLLTRITSTLFSGITSLAEWLGMIAGKQTGDATALTEIRATGAGSGTFDPTTDSTEAVRDRGDAEWITATGFLDAAGVRTAVGLASANLDTQLAALPTAAENADAVLDEALSGHTTAGTLGKAVADIETDAAAILVDTGTTLPAQITGLNNLSAADVNAEVVDALATDTYAEPTGVPGATVALSAKVGYLYMALRNGITITSTKKQFLDDAGNAEWEKDLSDDTTTYAETKGNAI